MYGLIVTKLMNAIKEVLVRTARRVIRDASASPQNLLKELARDISDRLRDWFLLQAALRWMAVSHLNSCWYVHPVRPETISRWQMTSQGTACLWTKPSFLACVFCPNALVKWQNGCPRETLLNGNWLDLGYWYQSALKTGFWTLFCNTGLSLEGVFDF